MSKRKYGRRFNVETATRGWKLACCAVLVLFAAERLAAAESLVGFVLADNAADILECDIACDLATRVASATILRSAGDGTFTDRDGRAAAIGQFGAIWCHEPQSVRPSDPAWKPEVVESLKRYVGRGRGLLLTGGAAAMVAPLGVDTVRIQAITTEQDYAQAGFIPLDPQHPALSGLDLDRGVLWMSNAAFPAFALFRPTGNPAKGMHIARTPGGAEIPLVEYSLGEGRVLAMGWQLGRLYDESPAAYRRNFEGLAANLVRYLGDAKRWRPLDMQADGTPRAARRDPPVHDEQIHSLERAIRDLTETFKERYPRGPEFLRRLTALKNNPSPDVARQFEELRRDALLANPLMDFECLLLVKRGANNLGLPTNYSSNSSIDQTGYDNQIGVLSPVGPSGKLITLFRPEGGRFVGDLDLHFDADRLLFSMPGSNGRWRVFEINADGSALHELELIREPDVDNYDACYLPDGRIVFGSTACFTGVPCVNGIGHVSNLYLRETNGRIRQLTVEQDHDWCPTVLNNGRLLYLRWEYTDLPHAFARILFHMNPDGTEQMEYYGSNSYWPGSMFFARPVPGHPTKVVAVVGGHHELPRMGDLVLFDPALGRFEADGAVQRIPGWGRKVVPAALDLPIAQSWPKFLHPWPLSEKYFLASCKPSHEAPWGVYLVDVFDNMLLLSAEPGYALLEPIPLRKTPRPPAVPDKVNLDRRDAEVLIADLYQGEGLKGVPRGTVKRLRVISYQFGYQGMGAEPYSVGLDGPWDPKLVLGTVPVCDDGSARFRVPAYTPISLQPLDAEGKAVQLMRSWITAMPGETVTCTGCHEKQNTAPPVRKVIAATRPPAELEPWRGPPRGFAFRREVQPVLTRHCLGCHDGKPRPDGRELPSFVDGESAPMQENSSRINQCSQFSRSYYQLRRFVRTPTKESDLHLLPPWEFHADTTRLVQLLAKGHYDVRLDAEAWDRLITWIDLGSPFHGNWTDIRGAEIAAEVKHQWQRRRTMRERYTGMDDDFEAIYPAAASTPVRPVSLAATPPLAPRKSRSSEEHEVLPDPNLPRLSVRLAEGSTLDLVRIPDGEFSMGQADGCDDERPVGRVKIERPFWIGRFEISNEQYALFDPAHDSRLEHGDFMQFSPGERGHTLARPKQPVVRVSWNDAMAFCRWLSKLTGRRFTLPTEAQWEYACRAQTATPFWYGSVGDDFVRYANLSDASHQRIERFGEYGRPEVIPPWRPADPRHDDRSRVSAPVGSYRPNPWSLCDMHGNVAEWTISQYLPYPYRPDDGRNQPDGSVKRVVRGGSWYDPPERCHSAFRQAYFPWQSVYDVGFRVVAEDER